MLTRCPQALAAAALLVELLSPAHPVQVLGSATGCICCSIRLNTRLERLLAVSCSSCLHLGLSEFGATEIDGKNPTDVMNTSGKTTVILLACSGRG